MTGERITSLLPPSHAEMVCLQAGEHLPRTRYVRCTQETVKPLTVMNQVRHSRDSRRCALVPPRRWALHARQKGQMQPLWRYPGRRHLWLSASSKTARNIATYNTHSRTRTTLSRHYASLLLFPSICFIPFVGTTPCVQYSVVCVLAIIMSAIPPATPSYPPPQSSQE